MNRYTFHNTKAAFLEWFWLAQHHYASEWRNYALKQLKKGYSS